ncbi:MAG: hypothetical protein J5535_02800 [Firmicutes bacterium]|nr:hypothetical protein [Bacillota bacterium]
MLKRIRDFIYDINDIFVAIVILLAAAGIIVWRSTAIMAYPDYLAAKNPSSNNVNVDFSGIDLTPENVQNINDNLEYIEPGEETDDPNGQTGEQDPNQGTEDPNSQTGETDPNQGTEDPNQGTEDPNQGEQQGQTGTVTATIEIGSWGEGERWPKIAQKLSKAGLISVDEEDAFVARVRELGLDTNLWPGTYELTNTSIDDMIKVICRQ